MKPTTDILNETIQAFRNARGCIVDAMPLLHQIASEELWKAKYRSFAEFCDECEISRSYASQLVAVWQHYAIEGKFVRQTLADVEPQRLYLALSLPGNAQDHFEKAITMGRSELRQQRIKEETGEEHVCQCRICGKKMN